MISTHDIEGYKSKLRKLHLKATPQRIAVHEAMIRLVHASADQVTADIKEHSDVKVTLSSVYNILSCMAELGVYQRRSSRSSKMYFDLVSSPHIHVYDCENDSYRDLADDELEAAIQSKLSGRRFRGYRIEGLDIQIVVRPSVRKKK